MESLAFSLGVSVVTSIDLTVAEEGSLRNLGVDGVVLAGNSGNVGGEGGEGIIFGPVDRDGVAGSSIHWYVAGSSVACSSTAVLSSSSGSGPSTSSPLCVS